MSTFLGTGTEVIASGFRIADSVVQANDFVAGEVVRFDFSTLLYVRSRANTADNVTWIGVVESATSESFVLVYAGRLDVIQPSVGWWFVDATTAGALTNVEPVSPNFSAPVLVATPTASVVLPRRPSFSASGGTSILCTSLYVDGTIGAKITPTAVDATAGLTTFITVNATSGERTITLPAVTSLNGRTYIVTKTDSTSNPVKIVPTSGTISGFSYVRLLSPSESLTFVCDESSAMWRML